MSGAELGLGTYRTTDVAAAAEVAIDHGVSWIDTAPNYQRGTAEEQLAPVLDALPSVRVSTKVGFLDAARQERATKAGVLTPSRTGKGYCLEPSYVSWQAAQSKAALRRIPDITFVHNPEHGGPEPHDLDARLIRGFRTLEECCQQGLIKAYGVATWSALHDGSLTVDRLMELAHMAGGASHKFAAIQLPLSLVQLGPIADALDGRGVLFDARAAGLEVFGSAPLHGGELLEIVTPTVAQEVLPGTAPIQLVLGTVASTPGVTRILLSASSARHWTAAAPSATPSLSRPFDSTALRKIVDAFRA
ncbi:aldo/keto reductase [Streptomyces sp. NPDC005262]|uniref:aldo/keto reductase n=1 Tax=Streptomyces sp. NPDC005262 TaxID=3364710 RepID=UPI003689B6A0